ARALGVEIIPLGRGFTWQGTSLSSHRECARQGWLRCRQALADPGYDAIILDEITYPVAFGWLDGDEVLAAIRGRPPHQHVLLTGRQAPAALIEAADLVTEMRECKHPQRLGVPAQRGVEF
ncbi:MAG: cob(I)yrinic acid a,c-diamide adenosyltransferase, partial [Armatimonadetes bacterium]|nr:cob(I)yrinic acid a,c-diamide adenosyltransferase [Armatimonadota bacterium]